MSVRVAKLIEQSAEGWLGSRKEEASSAPELVALCDTQFFFGSQCEIVNLCFKECIGIILPSLFALFPRILPLVWTQSLAWDNFKSRQYAWCWSSQITYKAHPLQTHDNICLFTRLHIQDWSKQREAMCWTLTGQEKTEPGRCLDDGKGPLLEDP